jgi:hypothetical protein
MAAAPFAHSVMGAVVFSPLFTVAVACAGQIAAAINPEKPPAPAPHREAALSQLFGPAPAGSESPALEVLERLLQLFARVHHEWAVLRNRLA